MKNKLKTLQETKNVFEKLKIDTKSVLFSEEKIDLKKLQKSSYSKLLLKLINLTENDSDQITKTIEDQIPTRLDFFEKKRN